MGGANASADARPAPVLETILDVTSELDLGPIIRAVDAKDTRGEKPYSP